MSLASITSHKHHSINRRCCHQARHRISHELNYSPFTFAIFCSFFSRPICWNMPICWKCLLICFFFLYKTSVWQYRSKSLCYDFVISFLRLLYCVRIWSISSSTNIRKLKERKVFFFRCKSLRSVVSITQLTCKHATSQHRARKKITVSLNDK